MTTELLTAAGSVLFSAGVAWGTFQRVRRDVNGLGRKINTMEKLLLAYCPEDQRKEIMKVLLGR